MANKTQRIKVTRAFMHKGKICGADSVLDVDLSLALEMRTANKAEFVQASEPKAANEKPTPPTVADKVTSQTTDTPAKPSSGKK